MTWRHIETAPKKPLDKYRYGPRVLAYNSHGICFAFWDKDFQRFFVEDQFDDHQQPTHWKPLPMRPR